MPIYEYRCSACGHQQEYLQKINDPPYTVCPNCSREEFNKMVTAAGFQLKGTGWYATDFKNGSKRKAKEEAKSAGAPKEDSDSSTCGGGACPACQS
jgi:putative FmdB family regulatory protein